MHAATPDWAHPGERAGATPARAGTRRKRSVPRRVSGALAGAAGTLVVLAIAAVAVALTVVPAIGGGHTLTVLSGSMVPELPVGSVVVDRPVPPESLHVGDVVTYQTAGGPTGHGALITHRIVDIRQGPGGPVFTTKGDANNVADRDPVRASQIRGELWYHVPYIGTARDFLTSRGGLTMLAGAVVLVGATWFLVRLFRPGKARSGGRSS